MRSSVLVFVVVAASACAPEIPDATYVCANDVDCPPEMTCVANLCRRAVVIDAGPCTPQDCTDLRAECGRIDDGCGTEIECGACDDPEVCGGAGGIANICDCQTVGCTPDDCGPDVSNGCGGHISCGGCDNGRSCDNGTCTCTPITCEGRCLDVPDGCGEILHCPDCDLSAGLTCGAGGPNVCGMGTCEPRPCMPGDCGPHADGCGLIVDCPPTCPSPQTCGGGDPGVPGRCGCTPQTCADMGPETCGPVMDICGTVTTCPECTAPETCGGGGTLNQCGCTPPTCASAQCGSIPNPCGGAAILCGPCPAGSCVMNTCSTGCADAAEQNDTQATARSLGLLPVIGQSFLSYNIEPMTTDQDWYSWSGDAGLPRTDFSFSAMLSGDQIHGLGIYYECAGIDPGFACLLGDMTRDPLPGCIATGDPTVAQVSISFDCPTPTLYVGVVPKAPSTSCTPYHLQVWPGAVVIDPTDHL